MKKVFSFYSNIFILFFALFLNVANAEEKNFKDAGYYFLIDADTKQVLLSKNADVKIAPSSMTKMMTAYVVFSQIKQGKIDLDNQCLIGRDAWRKSGSSMFLNYGDVVSIEDLLKGLLVVSGNDAAIALAQTTAGGYDNFIDLMNSTAQRLGMKNSQFQNPHGLNQEGHYSSLRDLAILTMRMYQDFPVFSRFLSIPYYSYGNIRQYNRNPLIRRKYEGIVGGKTGYTDDGGYGVLGMVKRDHRKLVGVVNKTKTPRQRSKAITALFDHGFKKYKKIVLFEKGQEVGEVETWLGKEKYLDVYTKKQVAINIPRDKSINDVEVLVKYKGPIYAPINKDAKVAKLLVRIKGYKTFEYALFSKEKIDKAGFIRRINQVLQYKISNFLNKIL